MLEILDYHRGPKPQDLQPLLTDTVRSDAKTEVTERYRSLIASIQAGQTSGDFNLTPSMEMAIARATAEEDLEPALKNQAEDVFANEIKLHPKLKTNRQKMLFIQKTTFKWGNDQLASHLGISADQVKDFSQRGLREKQLDKFRDQFQGLFAIASILSRYVEDVIDRRGTLATPNGLLSEFSIGEFIKAGKINIAVALADGAFNWVNSENYIEPNTFTVENEE